MKMIIVYGLIIKLQEIVIDRKNFRILLLTKFGFITRDGSQFV